MVAKLAIFVHWPTRQSSEGVEPRFHCPQLVDMGASASDSEGGPKMTYWALILPWRKPVFTAITDN